MKFSNSEEKNFVYSTEPDEFAARDMSDATKQERLKFLENQAPNWENFPKVIQKLDNKSLGELRVPATQNVNNAKAEIYSEGFNKELIIKYFISGFQKAARSREEEIRRIQEDPYDNFNLQLFHTDSMNIQEIREILKTPRY